MNTARRVRPMTSPRAIAIGLAAKPASCFPRPDRAADVRIQRPHECSAPAVRFRVAGKQIRGDSSIPSNQCRRAVLERVRLSAELWLDCVRRFGNWHASGFGHPSSIDVDQQPTTQWHQSQPFAQNLPQPIKCGDTRLPIVARPPHFENKTSSEHTPLSLVQFAPTAPKTGAIRGIFQKSQKSPEFKSVNKNTGQATVCRWCVTYHPP